MTRFKVIDTESAIHEASVADFNPINPPTYVGRTKEYITLCDCFSAHDADLICYAMNAAYGED